MNFYNILPEITGISEEQKNCPLIKRAACKSLLTCNYFDSGAGTGLAAVLPLQQDFAFSEEQGVAQSAFFAAGLSAQSVLVAAASFLVSAFFEGAFCALAVLRVNANARAITETKIAVFFMRIRVRFAAKIRPVERIRIYKNVNILLKY
ncbi:MAG: hypothetical protein VB072_03165 [Lentimicrobium sp.]|uniref:hypothetical protein n=1 Tax=Lentimicrobium sp. TaxID=2034841 RepID=UPI002B1FDACC|nr:hypothetical protein [Lentimicrobium sp.]MEA5109402.1 hypothetical protein [Lentimicrobium sp.]